MEAVKTTKWYVIKVTANQEKKVKEYIEKEIKLNSLQNWVPQVLIPTEKIMTLSGGKKSIRERIVMPGYLFIEADLSHGEIAPMLEKVNGVYGFLSMSDGKVTKTPIALRDREIDRFLKVHDDTNDQQIAWDKFEVGERVKILDGPFNSFEGVINKVDNDKNKLNVMVLIFARQTPVDVSFSQVEKVIEKKK